MARVVIDTNVLISSFLGGNPYQVFACWKRSELALCVSPPIVEEYAKVFDRLGLHDEAEAVEFFKLLQKGFNVIFVGKTPKLQLVKTDPSDNKFIECVVAAEAECIISGDRALLSIKNYLGIEILNPQTFLTKFRKEK